MMKRVIAIVFLISVFNASCNSGSGNRNAVKTVSEETALAGFLIITKVVDGDTFWAVDGTSKSIKVRLIGIDAPESRNVFKKKQGYYGKEAKEYLTTLLKGKYVKLEYDVDRTDQYGRTLAYVYLEDGTFVNAELLKNGYAMVMTIPPNVKFADVFVKHQQEARENKRGLWKE